MFGSGQKCDRVLERHTVFGSGQMCVCVCVCWSDTQCLVMARSVCVLLLKLTAHSLVLVLLLHTAALGTSLATCFDVRDASFLRGFIISCPRLCHLLALSVFRIL